jgi:cyanophycinase
MHSTHLFLFGSGPPFTNQLSTEFSRLVGSGEVAVLYLEREGSESYLPKYWEKIDTVEVYCLPLKDSYEPHELDRFEACKGVIIGGGNTEKYRDYIVDTELGDLLLNLFTGGKPIAGFSAGALISPKICAISPKDNKKGVPLFEKGLGLTDELIVAAHYLEWEEEQYLKEAISKTDAPIGLGIAERSGVYLKNNKLTSSEGYIRVEHNE